MTNKRYYTSWWKLSEGKYVANEKESRLDFPTQALVRDLIALDPASREIEGKGGDEIVPARLSESPLPFEQIHEWITWTVKGNSLDH